MKKPSDSGENRPSPQKEAGNVFEAARKAAIAKHHLPYNPKPQPEDYFWEVKMRHAASRMIMEVHPEHWEPWARKNYPDFLEKDTARHLLGTVLIYQGKLKKAGEVLKEALAFRELLGNRGRQASTLTNLGDLELVREKWSLAWNLLQKALELDPELPAIHLNRLCLAKATGNVFWKAEAMDCLRTHLPQWKEDEFLPAAIASGRTHCTCMR